MISAPIMDQSLSFALTSDGSKTLFNPRVGEHYHSRHGALQESRHVFLESGLKHFWEEGIPGIRVLEIGFGTGLNFLISADHCTASKIRLQYTGIEAYPLHPDLIFNTDYDHYISAALWASFQTNYEPAFLKEIELNPYCKLHIAGVPVLDFQSEAMFDVVYFDAFAAVHQPGMWTEETLCHVSNFLHSGGVFVTYAITGSLKRIMKQLGFAVEKAPGAPGKREMLRAVKR